MKRSKSWLVKEYERILPLYEGYTEKLRELIEALIKESQLSVHLVRPRTKDIVKLAEKVTREGKDYKNLTQVTDLSGIRIICLYSDTVDKVAELIKRNFVVIEPLSIDKRQALDPDRFGYISLHYVVKLTDDRANLPEYQKFKDLLAEIQIRSILQHAWAEIEHDLGYKIPYELPREFRRGFSRVAGLLELADKEFVDIKYDIERFLKTFGQDISVRPQDLSIDKISLTAYYSYSPIVQELDEYIAKAQGTFVTERIPYIDADIQMISHFNISTIAELDKLLRDHKKDIEELGNEWIKTTTEGGIRRGISVFYLCILLIGMTQDPVQMDRYLDQFPIIGRGRTAEIRNNIKEITKKIMARKSRVSSS